MGPAGFVIDVTRPDVGSYVKSVWFPFSSRVQFGLLHLAGLTQVTSKFADAVRLVSVDPGLGE